MIKFKKTLVALALGVSLMFSANSFAASSNTNLIVATYSGGNVVLLSDIKPYLHKIKPGKTYTLDQIHKAVNAYIATKLEKEWDAKARKAINISEDDVTNAIYDVAAKNGLTYDDFVKALAYHGISLKTYKANLRKALYQQQFQKFITTNVKSQIDRKAIQEQGFKMYNEAVKANKLIKIDTPNISYILIKTTPLFTGLQAKDKINSIYHDLVNKKITFAQAAQEYSNDIVSAAKGGDLGNLSDLSPAVQETINPQLSKLKLGKYTKPFYINNLGWVIVKLNKYDKIDANLPYYLNKAFEDYIASHFGKDTLQNYLLNSVLIDYKDFDPKAQNPFANNETSAK